MVTRDVNGQFFRNGAPLFSLGQTCKILDYPTGRTNMIKDFQMWGLLLKRNEPAERMKAMDYFIYHLHEYKTKSGVKMGEPVALVRIEGVAFLKKYVKRKLAKIKSETIGH